MARFRPLLNRIFAPAVARGRRFAADERGVTAVEFGLLALPFFTIIFAILQTAIMFLTMQVLDSALEDSMRMIRTGRAQAAKYTLADFRKYMCGYTFNLIDCSQIKIKVDTLSNFAGVNLNPAVQTCSSSTCTWTIVEGFNPGVRRQVVQIAAYYRYPLLVSLPYFNLRNQPDNYRLINAVRVFRNEPF
jgi:Flp pilus assembly protein TadG